MSLKMLPALQLLLTAVGDCYWACCLAQDIMVKYIHSTIYNYIETSIQNRSSVTIVVQSIIVFINYIQQAHM